MRRKRSHLDGLQRLVDMMPFRTADYGTGYVRVRQHKAQRHLRSRFLAGTDRVEQRLRLIRGDDSSGKDTNCALQRNHAHPEHQFRADVDIVFAHIVKLAVAADPKH